MCVYIIMCTYMHTTHSIHVCMSTEKHTLSVVYTQQYSGVWLCTV